jgi:hypothetical protein
MLPPDAFVVRTQLHPTPLPPVAANVSAPRGGVVAEGGETIETPAVTVTLRVARFPSESVTCTTSVTVPVGPAVYAPVVGSRVPPDAFVANDHAYPAPLPPTALNDSVARGATDAAGGEIETPAVTLTLRVATFPSESVTRPTSVTLPVEPATYAPVAGSMDPPDAFVANDHAYPVPLPPFAANACAPLGGTEALVGVTTRSGRTVTFAVLVFPRESVARITSVPPGMDPAWYTPVASPMNAPEEFDWMIHV